jgi:uncharacterized repeat protein (TIGR03803 family)
MKNKITKSSNPKIITFKQRSIWVVVLFNLLINSSYSQVNQFFGQIANDEFGNSSIFKMERDGSNFNLINDMLTRFYPDINVSWSLLDQKFYFTTFRGGLHDGGMIVTWDPLKSKLSKEFDFNDSGNRFYPHGILCVCENGKMYGSSERGGVFDRGVLFEWDATLKLFTKKIDFNPDDSIYYFASMMQAENGKFYAITYEAIIEWDSSTNVYKNIHYFQPFWDINGDNPKGKLVQASNGKIYGICEQGGQYNKGAIFEIDPVTLVYTKKIDFQDPDYGVWPSCTLIEADNHKLYGFTDGYSDDGSKLFEYDPETNQLVVKYIFNNALNGRSPVGSLTKGENGKLYGTTCSGGINGVGVIYEWDPITDIYSKKIDFDSSMSGVTYYASPLVQYGNGNFYGMFRDNKGGREVIFEWDVTNNCIKNQIIAYGDMMGQRIYRDLILADNGKIYGVTSNGGQYDFGTLIELDPIEDSYSIKNELYYSNSGSHPFGSLLTSENGKMYGMSSGKDIYNLSDGSIFEWDPKTCNFQNKFDFDDKMGSHPKGSLMQASNGKFYGMTENGGAWFDETNSTYKAYGVLFEWDPVSEIYLKKIDFNNVDGRNPVSNLVQANNGKLYGMTPYGGASNKGVLFEWDIDSNIYTKRIDFNNINGEFPIDALLLAGNGKLYGTTPSGGLYSNGVLFEFDPLTKTYLVKINFDGFANGATPGGSLIQSTNGKLYGVTMGGGIYDKGVLFEWDPATENFLKVIDFDGLEKGSAPYGRLLEISNATNDTIVVQSCLSYTSPSGKYIFTESGIYKDFLTSGTGCDSIITIYLTINSKSTSSTIQPKTCGSYTSPSGRYTWEKSGTYLDTIPNDAGCDSVITIELNILKVDPTLTFLSGSTEIISNDATAHHQWVDCNNDYSHIKGETGQSFKPGREGYYAVIVSYGWCADTSECVQVGTTGISPNPLQKSITLYPNPTNGRFIINLGREFDEAIITITEIDGRLIQRKQVEEAQLVELDITAPAGIYLVTITTSKESAVFRIMKN